MLLKFLISELLNLSLKFHSSVSNFRQSSGLHPKVPGHDTSVENFISFLSSPVLHERHVTVILWPDNERHITVILWPDNENSLKVVSNGLPGPKKFSLEPSHKFAMPHYDAIQYKFDNQTVDRPG